MDYEKKYKEALKKAEAFYYSATTEPISEREVLANIFPELKDSEDEMIRKNIIIALKSQKDELGDFYKSHNTSESELVSWLEKQGEKKETACDRCRKAQPNGSCQDITALGRCYIEGERKVKDTTVIYHESGLKALEKSLEKGCTEGEQKSADKAEPKFHEGDWIVDNCSNVWKIEGIINQFYILEGIDGAESRPTIEWVYKTFHLWSIEDAKDGDVLVADEMIVLFKKRLENDSILTYFHYDTIDDEYEPGAHLYYAHIYPATKEQRDTLIKAMADAGCTFDFEKKELKKKSLKNRVQPIVEWKHENTGDLTDFENAMMHIGESFFSKSAGLNPNDTNTIKEQASLLAELIQSKEWSEEDERTLQGIWDEILANKHDAKEYEWKTYDKFLDWLKSLRPQNNYNPYKEVVESIAEMCKHYDKVSHSGLRDFYDNVKVKCRDAKEYDSLFPQNTWKPSDEQMEAMQKALVDLCGKDEHNIITGLYYDLKKLREDKKE